MKQSIIQCGLVSVGIISSDNCTYSEIALLMRDKIATPEHAGLSEKLSWLFEKDLSAPVDLVTKEELDEICSELSKLS